MAELPGAFGLSAVFLAVVAAGAGGLAALAVARGDLDPLRALGGAAVVAGILAAAQLAAAHRMLRGLRAFADVVGGAPEVASDRFGRAALRWPDLGIACGGSVYKFHVGAFEVHAPGRSWPARVGGARDAAREALDLAGRPAPPGPAWDGRVPSAAAPWALLEVGVGALLLAALAGLVGLEPWWLAGAVAGAAGLMLLAWGDAALRRALRALLQGWVEEGLRVEAPVLARAGFHPRWVVFTSEGAVSVEGFALGPLDRLFVDRRAEGRRVRLARARDQGRELARAWRRA